MTGAQRVIRGAEHSQQDRGAEHSQHDLPMDPIFEIMDPIFEMCFEDALEFPGFCNTHGHPDRHYISHPLMISMCCASCSATRWTRARCYRSCSSVPRCEGLANVSGRSPRYDWHAPRVVSFKKNVVCQNVLCCAVSRNNDVCVCVLCFVVLFKTNGVCLMPVSEYRWMPVSRNNCPTSCPQTCANLR